MSLPTQYFISAIFVHCKQARYLKLIWPVRCFSKACTSCSTAVPSCGKRLANMCGFCDLRWSSNLHPVLTQSRCECCFDLELWLCLTEPRRHPSAGTRMAWNQWGFQYGKRSARKETGRSCSCRAWVSNANIWCLVMGGLYFLHGDTHTFCLVLSSR